MKNGIIKKIQSASLVLSMFFLYQTMLGQANWNVKLVSSGKYEVDITPTKEVMTGVKCKISLYGTDNKIIGVENLVFTNDKRLYLEKGKTYYKYYYCEPSIIKVIGTSLTYHPESVGGSKADEISTMTVKNECNSDLNLGDKIFIQDNSTEVKSGSIYTLRNMFTQNMLHGDNIPSGGNVRQYPEGSPALCQQWLFTSNGDGSYSLKNMDSHYLLHGDNLPSGGNVRQEKQMNSPCQSWLVIQNTNGTFSLKNKDSKYWLHGDNMDSGGNVRQYQKINSPCQQWQFTEVIHHFAPNH